MKRKPETSGDLTGFLDVGTEFHGDLAFKDTLRIDGKFEGTITSGSTLVIGETADVNAKIEVGTVSVNGRLRGSVHASDRVELHQTARVEASLSTDVLVVEEGAKFDGQCSMQKTEARPETARVDNLKKFVSS